MRNVRGSEKTNFSMAQASDYQVSACKKFFSEQSRFEPLNGSFAEKLQGPVYNITKFGAHKVVALLSWIVNDQEQYKEKSAFYFLIRKDNGKRIEELFKLTPIPTKHQPGNGLVSLFFKKENGNFTPQAAKAYDKLNCALKGHYKKDTKSFASDMKKLFRNNAVINQAYFPQVTIEVYMVLLFEIARRSVTSVDNPTQKKKQFDDLPIGSAIASLLKLLELGNEEICTFDHVFSGKFYCFAGEPEERRRAIDMMNETLHLQELSKLFRSNEQQVDDVDELAEVFPDGLNLTD